MKQYPPATTDGEVLTLDSTSPYGVAWAAGGGGGGAPTTATYVTVSLNGSLSAERTLAVESSVLSLTDGGTNAAITVGVATAGITNAKLRDSSATSVIGRAAGSVGAPADIVATADGQYLTRAAGVLTWATVSAGVWGTATVDLAGASAGQFTITDAALTLGMRVLVGWQPTDDEAEMDTITLAARSAAAGSVLVSWIASGPRLGNHTFTYSAG